MAVIAEFTGNFIPIKMDFFQIVPAGAILNFIGGTLRFVYGSVWRTVFSRPRFTFKEYISGVKGSYADKFEHEFNNRIIAFTVLGIVVITLVRY